MFENIDLFSILIYYSVSTGCELLGVKMNYITKYNLIKWAGGKGFNFMENVLTRMCGFYFFENAFIFSLLIKYYGYDGISKNRFE